MVQVTVQEAQEQILELFERVAMGEEVLIFRNNRPFLKIVIAKPQNLPSEFAHSEMEPPRDTIDSCNDEPVGQLLYRRPGSAKGLIFMADDFDEPLDDFQEYM